MKKALKVIGVLLLLVGVYLSFAPVDVDPIAWDAPKVDPGRWRPKSLDQLERIELSDATGPEDVEVGPGGRIFVGVDDGRILILDAIGRAPRTLTNTKGRPLGLHWAQDGRLLVTDAFKGLLAIDMKGEVEVLTSTCAGKKLVFTDDLEVDPDGVVWFTDASLVYPQPRWREDIVESRAHGRLCAYDPRTKETREVIANMFFANGVAVEPNGRFVLVNETSRYRVLKHWLKGEKSGTTETLIDNLPGFPDNISTGTGGIYWIAIANPRNAVIDGLSNSPRLRKAVMRLPDPLKPKPIKTARIIGIDEHGEVKHDLFDPHGEKIFMVTAVQERGGWLYLGSLRDRAFARMKRPVPW